MEIVIESTVDAPPDVVWARVASMAGVNDEMGPWLRMTAPAGAEISPEAVPLGERWFRSWILLFGVIPFDYDDLRFERIEPGRAFLERSTMLSARMWQHERTLEPAGDGRTVIRDRVVFDPRVRAASRLQLALVTASFRHRHRRLARRFGPRR